MTARSKPNVLFYIIALVFLLWNLIGVGFFFTEMFAEDMIVAQMNEHQERIYENRPAWYMGNYALAVFAGLVACIAMLFKHRSAVLFAAISFLAVLISTAFNFSVGAWEYVSTADLVTFLLVPIMGFLLALYTLYARKKGWLR
ncbi:hypothetical protein BST97_12910 [Nonlabens spongiae]|uniref:Sugar transporter n=1 Tax=Nonlabens spongiae TaxID=331648 RepID=A0A1W6MMK7_9FLAO|nr:hypothetical protein [Nonlabens spongiae]ARN78817.1 hypothetical protein BST97_12910 [Nonlabens spongiae]